eukprot:scaffold461954_cov20-Prasinocladus_malaysianus.AAC.1
MPHDKYLAALKVAIGRGGASLARLKLVGVHRQAHGAARLAPVKAGLNEDPAADRTTINIKLQEEKIMTQYCTERRNVAIITYKIIF